MFSESNVIISEIRLSETQGAVTSYLVFSMVQDLVFMNTFSFINPKTKHWVFWQLTKRNLTSKFKEKEFHFLLSFLKHIKTFQTYSAVGIKVASRFPLLFYVISFPFECEGDL